MIKVEVEIREEENGWNLRWPGEAPRYYDSAAKALSSVRKRARDLAFRGQSSSIRITWVPISMIGRQVIHALQENE